MKQLLLLVCVVLAGCSTPRVVEEHHHHHYQVDSAAVYEQVDRQLTRWHSEVEQFFSDRLEQIFTQQQQSEQQHETIQETVTETVDSLGRRVRQEQRTISRDMLNVQWSMVNKVTRELENRLQSTVDSLDSCWQMRYDSLAFKAEQTDSNSVTKTPAGDNRPLMDRIWDKVVWFGLGVIAFVLMFLLSKKR